MFLFYSQRTMNVPTIGPNFQLLFHSFLSMSNPGTVPAPGGQDTSPFGVRGHLQGTLGGRNWTWPLRIGCILIGIGYMIAGIFGLISIHINPLAIVGQIITSLYVILLGAALIVAIVPFPAKWHEASLKWFGLLHKYRGRGFYLIFVGVLAFSCGITGYIVGGIGVFFGLLHIVLAIWFKDTLDKTPPIQPTQEPTPQQQQEQKKSDKKMVLLDALF